MVVEFSNNVIPILWSLNHDEVKDCKLAQVNNADLMDEWGILETPTFLFFLNGDDFYSVEGIELAEVR